MTTSVTRRSFIAGTAAASVAAVGATGIAVAEEPATIQVAQQNLGWLEPEPQIDDVAETVEVEVLVIGGGTGGLEVGGSLAEKGLAPLIIEQKDDVSTLRNDFGAIGSRYQQENGTVLDERAIMNYHIMQNSARFDQRLPKIWARESGAAIDWIGGVFEQYGAVMLYEGGYEAKESLTSIPKFATGHSGHFDLSEFDDGKSILKQYILDCGGSFRFNTKFIKFEHEGKKVTDAIAQDTETGAYIRFVGKRGIVLTTGGYQNNAEMMAALQPETVGLYGIQIDSFAYGDGIKACLWMGAEMDDAHSTMLFDRMGVMPTDTPTAFTNLTFFQLGSQPWLKVNTKGERFFNESALYDYAPHASSLQPGKLCISVMDANYRENVRQFETVGCSRMYPFPNGAPNDEMYLYEDADFDARVDGIVQEALDGGLMQQADTLEELAEKMGLPVETFVATVERYNELAEKGDDEDFYKEAYRMIALTTPPFYAIRNTSFALSTLDGIRIDTHSHALDADGEPFEGLYVIGDCSGSYFAHSYPNLCTGYAHGRTCTFARRVAREINGEEVLDYTIMAK